MLAESQRRRHSKLKSPLSAGLALRRYRAMPHKRFDRDSIE
jgi:hypothetical protein